MKEAIEISENFIFNFDGNIGIDDSRSVLKKYYDNFEKAFKLENDYPIFLDTNILLNYYGMSKENKSKLKTFFEDKVDRIYITEQIEKEFQRNREGAISDYFDTLNKIKKNYEIDLQKGIKDKFNNLLQSKIVEQDFPEIMAAITKIYDELDVKLFRNESLMEKVSADVNTSIEESKNLLFIDPILDVYSKFSRIPNLGSNELEYIFKVYEKYLPIYKKTKQSIKSKLTFPGCGETKSSDKHGDFIIFHEILKFMKENNSDAILLTRDITKSDWLKPNRTQYIHYILKAYQLTGHILYIFDATDLLDIISFENIYNTENLKNDKVIEPQKVNFYQQRFLKIVYSVKDYFENYFDDINSFSLISNRSSLEQDLDLIGYRTNGRRIGVLVYVPGSTKKRFQRNVQKRVNACRKFIDSNLSDDAILAIVLNRNKENYFSSIDVKKLNSKYQMNIVLFYCESLETANIEMVEDIWI